MAPPGHRGDLCEPGRAEADRYAVAGTGLGPDEILPAAISVGTNPTFDGVERRVEAYVLDRTDLDLYDQRSSSSSSHLRPTLRFAGRTRSSRRWTTTWRVPGRSCGREPGPGERALARASRWT